jgi:hypothetical protein
MPVCMGAAVYCSVYDRESFTLTGDWDTDMPENISSWQSFGDLQSQAPVVRRCQVCS